MLDSKLEQATNRSVKLYVDLEQLAAKASRAERALASVYPSGVYSLLVQAKTFDLASMAAVAAKEIKQLRASIADAESKFVRERDKRMKLEAILETGYLLSVPADHPRRRKILKLVLRAMRLLTFEETSR